MKLLFKQQPSFIFRFYVTNQNNEWLYIIKKMAIMYQLYIYDAHENIVAKIEEDPKSDIFLFIKMRNILVL